MQIHRCKKYPNLCEYIPMKEVENDKADFEECDKEYEEFDKDEDEDDYR